MSNARLTCFLLCSVVAIGCGRESPPDTSADEQAIKDAFGAWVRVAEAGDADSYSTYITDDALILGPGQPVVGKAAIRPWVAGFFADWKFSFPKWTDEEIIVAGDVAIHRYSGVATLTSKKGADTTLADRKYIDILRREADGKWRVARHMFNLNQ